MARRSVEELLASVREFVGEKEGVENLLEDITDSYVQDMSNYVPKSDYDRMLDERDKAIADRESMRSKYINRFYGNYDKESDKGYILGQTPQAEIEKEEKIDYYERLFE